MKFIVTLSLEAVMHVEVEAENEDHAAEIAILTTVAPKIEKLPSNILIGYPEEVLEVSEVH